MFFQAGVKQLMNGQIIILFPFFYCGSVGYNILCHYLESSIVGGFSVRLSYPFFLYYVIGSGTCAIHNENETVLSQSNEKTVFSDIKILSVELNSFNASFSRT